MITVKQSVGEVTKLYDQYIYVFLQSFVTNTEVTLTFSIFILTVEIPVTF